MPEERIQGPGAAAPSIGKSLLFSVLLFACTALAVEGLLGALGFTPSLHREDPYVGFASRVPLFVATSEPDGRAMFSTAENKRAFFNAQAFAAHKSPGVRRAFCVGGSTTYGRPFDDATSFCGWLRELLEVSLPGGWEVVNAGGISYASYRAAALMEELARYEPDLFVVYSAHNEFLEERTYGEIRETPGWLRDMDALLRRTRGYSALRGVIGQLRGAAAAGVREALPAEVETRLDRSVGLDAYVRDDELRDRVLAHYRFNLERMLDIARAAGAEPLLVVPASNLRDCTPFKSTHAEEIDAAARERWSQLFQRGRDALAAGRAREARIALEAALAIDPRRAEAHFFLGRALDQLGDSAGAAGNFAAARDEDVCPLRALGASERIVREVARDRRVEPVDFPAILTSAAAQRGGEPFGSAYFLDHVHPTIEAHGLLAAGIADAMWRAGVLAEPIAPAALAAARTRVLASVDERAQGRSLRNLAKVLSWAGKSEDAARAARQALARLGADSECSFILGTWASERQRWEEAIGHYRRALRDEPDYAKASNNLGIALVRAGRASEAVQAYEHALRVDPGHANARYNLANALARLGRVDEAIEHYREVLRSDPSDGDAHHNLARLYERRGDRALAVEHYRSSEALERRSG